MQPDDRTRVELGRIPWESIDPPGQRTTFVLERVQAEGDDWVDYRLCGNPLLWDTCPCCEELVVICAAPDQANAEDMARRLGTTDRPASDTGIGMWTYNLSESLIEEIVKLAPNLPSELDFRSHLKTHEQ